MLRRTTAALLAASLSLALVACGGKPSTSPGTSDKTDAAPTQDAQQQLTAKLNAYIGCFNAVDSEVHGSARAYTGWIKDLEAGPSGRETRVYGPSEIDDYDMKQCDAPITEAIAAQPALPELDAAAGRYLQALKALVPLSHEAHDYYERQDYEDDQFAKGKQLHAPLMAAFKAFAGASETFNVELERQNDAAQREHLKALEQAEGRTREYYRLAMMLEAKAIMDLMGDDDFDPAQADERLQAFNRISDEAHAKVADQEPGKLDWNSFEREAENFRREGKERLQRVSSKTPYNDFERRMLDSPSMAPRGSAGRLLHVYNALVFQSNRQ